MFAFPLMRRELGAERWGNICAVMKVEIFKMVSPALSKLTLSYLQNFAYTRKLKFTRRQLSPPIKPVDLNIGVFQC